MLKGFETKQESLEASRAASVAEKAASERAKSRASDTKLSETKTKSESASQHGGSQTAETKKPGSRGGAKPGMRHYLSATLPHSDSAEFE